jgi:transcriptional regulator with XRE-family HTH domain
MDMSGRDLLNLGARVRALRLNRNLTVDEVARAVGIGRSTLSMIEGGRDMPGRENLFKIAAFYGVSSDYLCDGEVAPKPGYFIDDPDELAWNRLWRRMSDGRRSLALDILTTLGRHLGDDDQAA